MVLVADDYVWITKWHEDYQPDPHPQIGDIYSGLRAPAGSRAKDVTSPCQYWIKGMPGVCIHFSGDKCGLELGNEDKYPTGYNNGNCDYLGRRSWCSQYETGDENLEEYICIAPDMFRTGLGKRDTSVTTHLVLIPYPKSEILGYNPDDSGVGKCDGLGMGRGSDGEGTIDPERMYKLPVVCRHYKPWLMGFGAIKPRPLGTAILEGKNIYDGSEADPLTDMSRHLPFAFRVLNLRADYQKCAYWNQDFGTYFEMDYSGGYASISLPEDPLTECTCTDKACTPYKTIIETWPEHASDTLVDVLTEDGGIICNGANSECPCYTGKWYYCIADNMRDGMRITAEQILELRFWLAVWQTKEIYDSVFAEKSGPSGLTTSDIFTFDRWEKLGETVEDSVMKGKRIYQCFPIPLNQRVFDPEVYLTKEVITYPKATDRTGTSEPETSSFPTLVRKVDEGNFVPPLDVIYPYACKDPWNVIPCDESSSGELMEIASCKIEPPATAVFGYTIRNREVYALNVNKLGAEGVFNQFKETMVSLLPEKEKEKINRAIKNLIKSSMEDVENCKYITEGTSNEYGYFGIGPLQLEYNTTTTIAIVCKWSAADYEVVLRDVKSKFYGGCIVQDNFEFKYESTEASSGYIPTLPASFSPPAKLKGHVECFGGDTHSIFPVYSAYKYGWMQNRVYYSYCVNEYSAGGSSSSSTDDSGANGNFEGGGEFEGGGGGFGGAGATGSWGNGDNGGSGVSVVKWVRIGPTGYIWAEIDNINLSYLFDFEVVSAKISFCGKEDKIVCDCGNGGSSVIELDIIFPKTDDSDAIKREHILPNCVLLKAPEPQGFFNEDWSLFVEYKYKLLESHKASEDSEDENVVWPSDLDGEGSMNRFVSPPFSLRQKGNTFEIEDIRHATIAIMVYIEDGDSRIQAAVATKMLCDVVTTRCRPVEISYSYTADAIGYDLMPNSGYFTWTGGDKVLDGDYKHYNRPKCGDHDCNPKNCIGPMWFPFNDCTTIDWYNWYSGAASCTAPIEGQPRNDWRYCMTTDYKAWVRQGVSNWAAACANGWYYSYSKAGESRFSGYAKIRTSVLSNLYAEMGWTMPPFGNDGREITERWLSQEHYGFWDWSGMRPEPRSEYMPLVFDDEMLFTSFNAFDEKGRIGLVDDYLHTTCMLNCMLSDIISEEITEDRYRFEDLFKVITHAWCMYPPPIYEGLGTGVTVKRYSFKIENVAWAWREYWKNIERGTPTLNFVEFNRPAYYFDFEKTEHRLITDEGNVNIIFIAPIRGEGDSGFTYPEISIDGAFPRKFKIIYDDYNSEQIEWMDEGGDGTLGSSGGGEFGGGGGGEFGGGGASGSWGTGEEGDGGEGEGDSEGGDGTSIYENAMGNEWFHDDNTIFDANASSEKSDDRKIVLSGDTYAWYNRGLIANIPKNRLIYLPYEERKAENIPFPDVPPDSGFTWHSKGPFSTDVVLSYIGGGCVTRIIIEGSIGITAAEIYNRPQITIAECGVDDDSLCSSSNFPSTVLYKCKEEEGDDYLDLQGYSIVIELTRLPKRMLYSSPMLKIKFTVSNGRSLKLSGMPTIFTGFYKDAEETIKVWEQKYVVSIGEFGNKNPDGPESFELRSYERNHKNAGQYFPTGINSTNSESMQCRDKMTMIGAGKQYYEDKDLSISKGNLKSVEKDEQQALYEKAYDKDDYDTINYSIIIPPNIQQFFDAHNMYDVVPSNSCVFTSTKLAWDNHAATTSFNQDGNFWSPGGHYFVWGSEYYKTRCMIIGPIKTIYSPICVHHKHGGGIVPWNPYEAYVGWSKFYYYWGGLNQAILVGKKIDRERYDWGAAGAGFVVEIFH